MKLKIFTFHTAKIRLRELNVSWKIKNELIKYQKSVKCLWRWKFLSFRPPCVPSQFPSSLCPSIASINTVHFPSLLFSLLPAKENVIKSQFLPLEDCSFHAQQPAMWSQVLSHRPNREPLIQSACSLPISSIFASSHSVSFNQGSLSSQRWLNIRLATSRLGSKDGRANTSRGHESGWKRRKKRENYHKPIYLAFSLRVKLWDI